MLAVAAWFVALIVVGSTMGMFGNMFEGFFGPIGLEGTPAAGGAGRAGAVTTPAARAVATPTVSR